MSVYLTLDSAGIQTFPHTCQIIYAMYFNSCRLNTRSSSLELGTGCRRKRSSNGIVRGAPATWATGWFILCVITTLCLTSGTLLADSALVGRPLHPQLSITISFFVWCTETVRTFFTSPRDSVSHHRASSANLLLPSEYPVSITVDGHLSERPAGRSTGRYAVSGLWLRELDVFAAFLNEWRSSCRLSMRVSLEMINLSRTPWASSSASVVSLTKSNPKG